MLPKLAGKQTYFDIMIFLFENSETETPTCMCPGSFQFSGAPCTQAAGFCPRVTVLPCHPHLRGSTSRSPDKHRGLTAGCRSQEIQARAQLCHRSCSLLGALFTSTCAGPITPCPPRWFWSGHRERLPG